MKHFKFYEKQDITNHTRFRRFETKIGERLQSIGNKQQLEVSLQQSTASFVLFGIPEDIGMRANSGTGVSGHVWESFIKDFCNLQSNDFLNGEEVLVLGYFDFTDIKLLIEQNAHGHEELVDAYRHAVNFVDEAVESLAKLISSYNKIPIAVGGGRNNAYPLIKGVAKGLHKNGKIELAQINCISLDASTGYGALEGRHSGNAFRYADEDGYLQKYFIVGVHENELPQNVWLDIVNNPFIDFISGEDIFLHEKRNFIQAVSDATGFTDDTHTGIELSLESMEAVSNGSGLSRLHARQFINFAGRDCSPAYLHICESDSEGARGTSDLDGSFVSCLVADFIKAVVS